MMVPMLPEKMSKEDEAGFEALSDVDEEKAITLLAKTQECSAYFRTLVVAPPPHPRRPRHLTPDSRLGVAWLAEGVCSFLRPSTSCAQP